MFRTAIFFYTLPKYRSITFVTLIISIENLYIGKEEVSEITNSQILHKILKYFVSNKTILQVVEKKIVKMDD